MSEKKGFFKGVVIGGIIGTITALLFAPKSGEELRADIKKKLDEASAELGHKIQEAKNLAAQAKDLSAQLASSTKKVVDTSKKEVERIHKKAAQERAKKQYTDPSKSPADKK